jgi:trk system potassium uptake protein TrkA
VLISVTIKTPAMKKVHEMEEDDVKVIGIERDEEFIFLDENDEIKENDLLYIYGDREKIKKYLNLLDTVSPKKIKNILIYVANELGIEIAKILLNFDLNVKILEKDENLATKAAEILGEEASIVNSSYEDEEILLNEGVQYSDIAVTASTKDESNIIKSLQARKLGIKKIITINNKLNYYSLMHSLRLSTIRGPKIAAFYEILEEIDSRLLVYERFFLGARGKIFIKQVFSGKIITPPKEKAKVLILRDDKIYTLKGSFDIKEGDIIMEFNFSGNKKWIEIL